MLASSYGDAINAAAEGYGAAFDLATGLGRAMPFVNLVVAIANGDETGMAVATTSIALAETSLGWTVPYVGWAYAVYSIVRSLFGGDEPEIPDPWGSGQYVWNGDGIAYQAAGETGGKEAVEGVMNRVEGVMNSALATLNSLIERVRQQSPGSRLGIIPNRMPSLGYDMSGYRYSDIDPLTGAEKHPALRFDTSGRPYNAEPGSPESYRSIIEGVVRSALSRGAIAPLWEVQTARRQTEAGDPKAGLSEEERAGRDGQLAAPLAGSAARRYDADLPPGGARPGRRRYRSDRPSARRRLRCRRLGLPEADRLVASGDAVPVLDRRGLAGMAWVDGDYDSRLPVQERGTDGVSVRDPLPWFVVLPCQVLNCRARRCG